MLIGVWILVLKLILQPFNGFTMISVTIYVSESIYWQEILNNVYMHLIPPLFLLTTPLISKRYFIVWLII